MILQDSLKMKQPTGPTTARAQPKNPQLCVDAWEQRGKATAAAYANHGNRNDRNISVPVHKYIYILYIYIYVYIYIERERERDYRRGPKLLAELLKPAEAPISRPRRPNILSDR